MERSRNSRLTVTVDGQPADVESTVEALWNGELAPETVQFAIRQDIGETA